MKINFYMPLARLDAKYFDKISFFNYINLEKL